ncbi:hypothetical protein [Microbacterium sp. VKM Ac-2923]|uniref:hypothetical protein n=1 Tax=Microbacterium sp. VKM Ac-2923 TaxID=2929476 RepID=UPI001FB455ED|nr:hypothetical protein [Microbacterium sp. VKM Ac-2923]MCJ1707096.1 hypothetical protein [Microbacterium sp. VKM Ac-2923]
MARRAGYRSPLEPIGGRVVTAVAVSSTGRWLRDLHDLMAGRGRQERITPPATTVATTLSIVTAKKTRRAAAGSGR